MSREEQKRISDLATQALKQNRSKEEILITLTGAGIIDNAGKLKSPYDQIFIQK